MKKPLIISFFIILVTSIATAQQFDLSAELRPRFEYKHGYKNLIPEDEKGASFISQRTRINFGYKSPKLNAYVSLQDARVWGDVKTISSNDKTSSLHQAWAEATFSEKISLKLGRQEIAYDDQRIFGSVNWAQQARSHDAFIFKFLPNKNNRIDVGFAINADNQGGTEALYSNVAGYKSFQYGWYHGDFDKFGVSMLLLNTGVEYEDINTDLNTDYMQTIGPRLTYKSNAFSANGAMYYQFGKLVDTKVETSYFAGNLGYQMNANFSIAVGMEYLSGKDTDDTSNKIKSFTPLFGTNHKFNGWMDYFYVGNYGDSAGLNDINFKLAYKKDKFSIKIIPHFFSTAANVYNNQSEKMDTYLGAEIDMSLGYKIAKDINLSAGYSQMFATDTMEVLKGGDKGETNNWGWIMFRFNPTLFSHTSK